MVGPLEQAILALMIFVIMLGMGASLTPRDFALALKRPYGLFIGVASQYGFMPFIAFLLAISLPVPDPIKIGILIMGCMPGGTTSNIFTYFSKGNLALSVLMTVNSTVFGVVLIPLVLVLYAGALDLQIPRENIIVTLVLLLVPVAIGMGLEWTKYPSQLRAKSIGSFEAKVTPNPSSSMPKWLKFLMIWSIVRFLYTQRSIAQP